MKLRHGKGRKALSDATQSASKRTVTNRFETFRCQACGRGVKRKSRQQRFCSDRCRDFARREKDASQINARTAIKNSVGYQGSGQPTNPLFLSNKVNGLQGQKSGSSIPLNVLGGYRWSNAVGIDRGLLRKIVRAEIGAWVREKAEGIGSAPDQSDEPSAPPGAAVRASAKSFPARSAEELDVIEDKSKRRYSVGGATSHSGCSRDAMGQRMTKPGGK
jgi:hypothetical protein